MTEASRSGISGVRHSTKTVKLARDLYEGGWSPPAIHRHLANAGINPVPHVRTIRLWVIPGEAEARAERRRKANRRRDGATMHKYGPYQSARLRLERLRELREAGISYEHLAILSNHDYGTSLNGDRLRYLLKESPGQRTTMKYLAPHAT